MSATNAGTVIYGILVSGNYIITNNIVRLGVDETGADVNNSISFRGLTINSGSNKVYYNTVLLTGSNVTVGSDTTFALKHNSITGTNIYRNNIFANTRVNNTGTGKHYAMTAAGSAFTPSGLILNNNNYYTSTTPLAVYNGADKNTLADWRTSVGLDANSMVEAPVFVAPNGTAGTMDLHIVPATQSLMESGGAILAGTTTDIDGDTRPGPVGSVNGGGLSSDIGADEFDGSLFQINMGVQMLTSPAGSCATSGKTVTFRIKNYANQTLNYSTNPVTVTASVSGPNPAYFGSIILNSGSIAPNATQDVTFSTSYDMTSFGTYTFDANTSVIGDANLSNDAMPSTDIVITALTAGSTTSNITQFCNSTGIPTLINTAVGGDYQWYKSTVSAHGPYASVGTNSTTYTPSSVQTATTFYMATISCNSVTIGAGDTVSVHVPSLLSSTGDTRCGAGIVNLTATVGVNDSINWYASPTGIIPLYTGTTYSPSVTTTTNFYVAATAPGSVTSVNAGLVATSNHIGGVSSLGYGSQLYNDGIIPTYGLGTANSWGWVTTGGWIEYTWPTAQAVTKVVFYKDDRPFTTMNIEYWDGTTYQPIITGYTGSGTLRNVDSVVFSSSYTTTKIRFNLIQGSSPNFREIEVYAGVACESARATVTATVNPLPTAPSATTTTGSDATASVSAPTTNAPTNTQSFGTLTTQTYTSGSGTWTNPYPSGATTGTGTLNISASASAGATLDWFANLTGGSALTSSSLNFTTPSISVTTPYYAQARNTTTGCIAADPNR
jgi:hypothetical protein